MIKNLYRAIRLWFYRWLGLVPLLRPVKHSYPLVRLGTEYGGCVFIDAKELYGSIVVSCGLGEDATFDVEFAAKYDAKVLVVDPTPRAVAHFNEIVKRYGKNPLFPYAIKGAQLAGAYDLSNLSDGSLILCEKALWNENTTLRFYAPKNLANVSYSIVNFQNDYSTETEAIEVEATSIDKLLQYYNVESLPLIKLDIEGAEVEVILDMMNKKIYPHQILVEFHGIATPSLKSKRRVELAHQKLIEEGYLLVNIDNLSNYLYCRSIASENVVFDSLSNVSGNYYKN